MRSILNISLPAKEKKEIEKRAKKTKQTVSSYVLNAIKLEQSLIQEDELIQMAKQAEKEYQQGKTRRLKSLKDIM